MLSSKTIINGGYGYCGGSGGSGASGVVAYPVLERTYMSTFYANGNMGEADSTITLRLIKMGTLVVMVVKQFLASMSNVQHWTCPAVIEAEWAPLTTAQATFAPVASATSHDSDIMGGCLVETDGTVRIYHEFPTGTGKWNNSSCGWNTFAVSWYVASGNSSNATLDFGNGDVVGAAGAINGNIVLFDGNTGKLIKDSNTSLASILNDISNLQNTAGDVYSSGVSTDNAIVRFDGTTGKIIQDSAITIDDDGNIHLPLSATGLIYKDDSPFMHATGDSNVFLGENTGNLANAGYGNTVVGGDWSASNLVSGDYNTVLGSSAFSQANNSSNNIIIGFNSGNSDSIADNNIYVGNWGSTDYGESYTTRIGVSGTSRAFIRGVYGSTPLGSTQLVVVDNNGQLGSTTFSAMGVGDVVGAASAVSGNVAIFDGTTGKLIKDTGLAASSLVSINSTTTLTNKSLIDNSTFVIDVVDATKRIGFDASGTTNTTTTLVAAQTANRTITLPDATTTLVGTGVAQTLTNKTLTSPTIATIVNVGTLTLPTATTTLVGRTTTDTLTNKSLSDTTTFVVNASDATKKLAINLSGQTTSTTTQLVFGSTANSTITIPDGSTTLVGDDTVDTLTNKTITDASNDIAANSLKTASGIVSVAGASPPSAGQVLTATGTSGAVWATPAGGGNVNGPGSSTDNAIARFDGTTGAVIQNSVVSIADTTGVINIASTSGNLQVNGANVFPTSVSANTIPKFSSTTGRALAASGVSIDGSNNISTSGGVYLGGGSLLDTYQESGSTSITFTGDNGGSTSTLYRVSRIGNIVVLTLAPASGSAQGYVLTATTTLPTWAWPLHTQTCSAFIAKDEGSLGTVPAFLEVNALGHVYLYRTGRSPETADVQWTNPSGIPRGATISYIGS